MSKNFAIDNVNLDEDNKIATRESFGKALAKLKDKNVIVLDADLDSSTKTDYFKKKFPERFIEVGIAEADMIGTAAGFATCRKIPFAATFAMFEAGRAYDQIRCSVAYPKLNVKICGTHAGITVGEDGATHQMLEDINLMRGLPNMVVVCPSDDIETKALVEANAKYEGPVYLRLSRQKTAEIYTDFNNKNSKDVGIQNFKIDKNYKITNATNNKIENNIDDKCNNSGKVSFEIGKGIQIGNGQDATIIATGVTVAEAIKAQHILAKNGINVRVIDMHTIKPIDKDLIIKSAKETNKIITIEDHSIIGGLGSAVCEVLSENYPKEVIRMGIKDTFGKSGKPENLMKFFEIDSEA